MNAPKSYTDAGAINIIGGAVNILTGIVLFMSFIWVCVGVFWLIPAGVGLYQLLVGLAMNKGERHPASGWIAILGLVAAVFNINPIAIALNVFGVIKARDPEVAGYLSGT